MIVGKGCFDFFRNFCLLEFDTYSVGDSSDSPGDFLILNLVTRKKFWMRRATIASEIREKTGRLDLNNFEIEPERRKSQATWKSNSLGTEKDKVHTVDITMMVTGYRHGLPLTNWPTRLG